MSVLNSSNSSNEIMSSYSHVVDGKIPKGIAYCILFLVSIVGNSVIVWIIYRDNRLKTSINFLVANMAISDLLATIFGVSTEIVKINFDERFLITNDSVGLALCKLCVFLLDTSTAVSLYSCVFIAIDRYYAVARPLKVGFSRSRLKYIIPGIWIFSGLITSPALYYFQIVTYEDFHYCIPLYENISHSKIHIYSIIALNVAVPLPIVSVLYILIVYKLHYREIPGNQTDLAKKRREHQNKQVFKMSLTIVLLLYISHLFGGIVIILLMEGYFNNLADDLQIDLVFTAIFMIRMTFAYNFFIYVIFNDIYRENVKAIIRKWRCWLCHCKNGVKDGFTLEVVGQELERL